ncbi:hypothetical protein BH11ARM1_BH11ARM1_12230 [soil metagenome]
MGAIVLLMGLFLFWPVILVGVGLIYMGVWHPATTAKTYSRHCNCCEVRWEALPPSA